MTESKPRTEAPGRASEAGPVDPAHSGLTPPEQERRNKSLANYSRLQMRVDGEFWTLDDGLEELASAGRTLRQVRRTLKLVVSDLKAVTRSLDRAEVLKEKLEEIRSALCESNSITNELLLGPNDHLNGPEVGRLLREARMARGRAGTDEGGMDGVDEAADEWSEEDGAED